MGRRFHLGLGANLGDPAAQLRDALARMGGALGIRAVSRFFRSPAFGVEDQPDFVNAVATVDFDGPPQLLMAYLLEVEREGGRIRDRRWGPRTLDLDILAMEGADGPETYSGWQLEIPHPGILLRAFVLAPLRDVDPGWRHPVSGIGIEEAWSSLPERDRLGTTPLLES